MCFAGRQTATAVRVIGVGVQVGQSTYLRHLSDAINSAWSTQFSVEALPPNYHRGPNALGASRRKNGNDPEIAL